MAKISIAITTPTALILDPDGRAGTGTVTIKPNAPFQYTSGSVYQVTDETVQVAISEGMLVSALNLAPNAGASNLPETYYIVTIDVNTVSWVEYWQLQNTPTSLTWGEVTRVAGPNAASPNALASHLAAPNPHPQYVLEAVTLDAATIGSYNGRGGIPRVDPATGTLPVSFVPVSDVVSQVITNGVTTKAPSEDAVFDALALKQPLDADLTTIAGLSPSNDDVIQRKAGAWASRTMAQLTADVVATTEFDDELAGMVTTQEQMCDYSLGGTTTNYDTATMAGTGDVGSVSDINSKISGVYRVLVLLEFKIMANGAGDFDLSANSVSNCSVNNIIKANVNAQGFASGAHIVKFVSFNVVPSSASPNYKVTWESLTAGVADYDLIGTTIIKTRVG